MATAFLDATAEGPRLLTLDATSPIIRPSGQTILSALLPPRLPPTPGVLAAACASVAEFGYVFNGEDDRMIDKLVVTIDHTDDHAQLDYLVRLALLLLEQPSCTSRHFNLPMQMSCLLSLLLGKAKLAVLPLAVALQQRQSPPLAWGLWVPQMCVELAPVATVEFALRFLLSTPLVCDHAKETLPPAKTPLRCTPTKLMLQVRNKLEAHTQICQSGASAEEIASSADALRRWFKSQLEDLPNTCLSATMRDQLVESNSAVPILSLVTALRDRPEAVHLDECNDETTQSLIGQLLRSTAEEWRLLEPVLPQLIARVEVMDPAVFQLYHSWHQQWSPAARLFESDIDLLEVARSGEEDGPFERLHWALLEKAIGLNHSELSIDGLRPNWLERLSTKFFRDNFDPVTLARDARGIQRLFDRLLVSQGAISRTSFAPHIISSFAKVRGWCSVHKGTDYPEVAASITAAATSVHTQIFNSDVTEYAVLLKVNLEHWRTRHWPMVRGAIAAYLIPDLASIVIEYLQAPLLATEASVQLREQQCRQQ